VSWFAFSACWSDEVRSAVAFLSHCQPHLAPPNFAPFLNCCDRIGGSYQGPILRISVSAENISH
jgi:hypothetical protein